MRSTIAAALLIAGSAAYAQENRPTMASTAPAIVPKVAQDHEALLASPDPKLAANKRLVYDMYRIVLQAGLADRAGEFIREDYVQHNPNAGQGLAGVQEYVRSTRPEREIRDKLDLPLIHLMAEGDYVMTSFVRPEKDQNGQTYYATWFDLYRIADGKIAEHWDPMLKSDPRIDPNDKRLPAEDGR
ncbi:nuclear transport factor 2 family protein [Croceibacterium soli]|nr:nuclear transport factor 2 family protein [Croceibacterium soli]